MLTRRDMYLIVIATFNWNGVSAKKEFSYDSLRELFRRLEIHPAEKGVHPRTGRGQVNLYRLADMHKLMSYLTWPRHGKGDFLQTTQRYSDKDFFICAIHQLSVLGDPNFFEEKCVDRYLSDIRSHMTSRSIGKGRN